MEQTCTRKNWLEPDRVSRADCRRIGEVCAQDLRKGMTAGEVAPG